MYRSVYDLKSFYNSKTGRIIRRVLQSRLREFWPDVHGLRIMGCGYSVPYLRIFMEEAERTFAVMPAAQGAHHWPQDQKNLVCLAEEGELPFETASIDRIILVHSLEYSELLQPSMQEIWRVLKGNGRLLVIVPNRGGFWARADWSPFGQGTPYSASQITNYLHDNLFVHENTEGALYMPPLRFGPVLKSAIVIEELGKRFLPFGAGLHIVEATKQLYARSGPDSGSKVVVRGRAFMPRPVPQGLGRTS